MTDENMLGENISDQNISGENGIDLDRRKYTPSGVRRIQANLSQANSLEYGPGENASRQAKTERLGGNAAKRIVIWLLGEIVT